MNFILDYYNQECFIAKKNIELVSFEFFKQRGELILEKKISSHKLGIVNFQIQKGYKGYYRIESENIIENLKLFIIPKDTKFYLNEQGEIITNIMPFFFKLINCKKDKKGLFYWKNDYLIKLHEKQENKYFKKIKKEKNIWKF